MRLIADEDLAARPPLHGAPEHFRVHRHERIADAPEGEPFGGEAGGEGAEERGRVVVVRLVHEPLRERRDRGGRHCARRLPEPPISAGRSLCFGRSS